MKKRFIIFTVMLVILTAFAGCRKKDDYNIDYLVLVNKLNPLPEDWEEKLQTVHFTNTVGNDVEVEKRSYEAYQKLKKDLEKEGIFVDLDSARRSIAAQQEIVEDFTKRYGADYTAKVVAKPGYSEHHTGLALDLYLIIDGKNVDENEDMLQYPEIWEVIHEKLDDYGFILRYLPDKEHITGYAYEPWHIRYVNDSKLAKEIMDKGITLEGYLGTVKETDPEIVLGNSMALSREELEEVAIRIKCQFASWEGCELESVRFAGDEYITPENVDMVNLLGKTDKHVLAVKFFTDFRTPKEGYNDLKGDHEYKDFQWWLACDVEGDWDIVIFGE